jgi:hypothetical protein
MHALQHASLDTNGWIVEHNPLPVRELCDTYDSSGFDARSVYVETYWLPILGPSCVFAARRLAVWLQAEPGGFQISMAALATSLGLGSGVGRHAPIVRTLARLVDFGLANISDTYSVRMMFPPLSTRQIVRLPDHLAAAHATDRTVAAVSR